MDDGTAFVASKEYYVRNNKIYGTINACIDPVEGVTDFDVSGMSATALTSPTTAFRHRVWDGWRPFTSSAGPFAEMSSITFLAPASGCRAAGTAFLWAPDRPSVSSRRSRS